jgi:hypothetical protein
MTEPSALASFPTRMAKQLKSVLIGCACAYEKIDPNPRVSSEASGFIISIQIMSVLGRIAPENQFSTRIGF